MKVGPRLQSNSVRSGRPADDLRGRGLFVPVPRRAVSPFAQRWLPRLAAVIGVALGVAIVILSTLFLVGPGNQPYWETSVAVPANANATHPYEVTFHGAIFSMSWPPSPPANSISTGVMGVEIRITESSGVLDTTATGCAECGPGTQSWYSPDGSVGIAFNDGELGTVTLLVAV
jgi:hypothetical protein